MFLGATPLLAVILSRGMQWDGEGSQPVQHESTATGTDLEGRGYTLRDGNLRGWTWVDVAACCLQAGGQGFESP